MGSAQASFVLIFEVDRVWVLEMQIGAAWMGQYLILWFAMMFDLVSRERGVISAEVHYCD